MLNSDKEKEDIYCIRIEAIVAGRSINVTINLICLMDLLMFDI